MNGQPNLMTALYCRLSRDDDGAGDSNSIQHQRAMLGKYAKENGFANPQFYVDDGYSGTNFDRPDFRRMIEDVEAGKVGTVITKDLSRLGREYLQTGMYIEVLFPRYNVRYIAVNDGVDSLYGENEFTPFRNIVNEWTARDISKKIKSVFRTKALNGEHYGSRAPYGYNRENNRLYVDEEVAPIVRRIYEMCMNGKGPNQIAKALKADKILTPEAYEYRKTGKYASESAINYPYHWSGSFVAKILSNKAYIGCVVNGKTRKPSFKNKHVEYTDPSEHIVVPDMHESIIDRETFEIVQKLRESKKRPRKDGTPALFSGILKCADCGKNMSNRRYRADNADKRAYACNTYVNKGKDVCTMHHIREDVIYQIVLEDVQRVSGFATKYESRFIELQTSRNKRARKAELQKANRELAKTRKRIAELDSLFQRIYEDNVNGKLTDERFVMLSGSYDWEQGELREREQVLQDNLREQEIQNRNTDKFLAIVKKYTDIQELTPPVLRELIEKIVVHEADKSSGERLQQVDIHYNFVGMIPQESSEEQTA